MSSALANQFSGAKVLVTGHTGFKGSWLCQWLLSLGSSIVGVSVDIPTKPSHFDLLSISKEIKDIRIDINDLSALKEVLIKEKPDFIFHLAAQPIVKKAFNNPIDTWRTNTFGTINILESLRELDNFIVAIFITSDKCYDNVEWCWGYKESDKLGGADPYSASKGAAEIAISSYVRTYLPKNGNIRIGIGRAGNVIGGGDWASSRIVPDCMKSWSKNQSAKLRNPFSTRPWQHVLEPLSGYLALASSLKISNSFHGEAFNFGPSSNHNYSVLDLVNCMANYWDKVKWIDTSNTATNSKESGLLKLNCDKALHYLKWSPVWEFEDTVKATVEWYKCYYEQPGELIFDITKNQIYKYTKEAEKHNLLWTK